MCWIINSWNVNFRSHTTSRAMVTMCCTKEFSTKENHTDVSLIQYKVHRCNSLFSNSLILRCSTEISSLSFVTCSSADSTGCWNWIYICSHPKKKWNGVHALDMAVLTIIVHSATQLSLVFLCCFLLTIVAARVQQLATNQGHVFPCDVG